MFLKFKNIFIFFFTLSLFFVSIIPALAVDNGGLSQAAYRAGINDAMVDATPVDPIKIIGSIIQFILSFLGVIFFLLTIYGGFLWMTARGAQDQVGKAKKIIADSIVGLFIVLLAYTISSVVVGAIIGAV